MPRVRVIGSNGEMIGILSRDEALQLAEEEGLDLVEIQPNADPPVCKIMDFGKFRFEQQKKASEARKRQKQVEIKELKFRPVTDEGRSWAGRWPPGSRPTWATTWSSSPVPAWRAGRWSC